MAIVSAAILAFLIQGGLQLGQQVNLLTPKDGHRLSIRPPASDFRIEVRVTCDKPGTILDTVGINAAPTGSYTLFVGPDRKVTFQVWQPGWTFMTSTKALGTGPETIVVSRRGETVSLYVGGETSVGTIKAPLSQEPLWVGDFHGDESWGEKYSIHRGMVGSVTVLGLQPVAASADLVIDETGSLDASVKARIAASLAEIGKQTGGRLLVVFTTAETGEQALASAIKHREAQQAANPNLPVGVMAYGPGGRGYSRTTTFDAKIDYEKVKAAWAATEGATLAEHVAEQMGLLAGTKAVSPTPLVLGEAKIGPEGGKVSSLTGDFELSIPSGALPDTQTVKVTQINSGSYGRFLEVDAGGRLLAKPATLTYKIPEGVDTSTLVAVGHVTGDLWMIHPTDFNPATRTLTAKTNHFSNQGWFGMNKKQHQAAGAVISSFSGTGIILLGSKFVLGAAINASPPVLVVVALLGVVGWFAGGTEYDMLMKRGFNGPIPVEGFDVYWKPGQVAGKGEAAAIIHKPTKRILTWVKDTDQWQGPGQGGTFEIQLPKGETFRMEDLGSVKVPTAVMTLAAELSTTKKWYDAHGFKPPEKTPVLITNELGKLPTGEKNAGEFEGTFLQINGDLLDGTSNNSLVVRATVAHEYFHAISKHHGYGEQFTGSEEAVAVAVESLVWPGANDGMTMNGWNVTGPVLQNGLKGSGQGEGFSTPDRRGYVLWSFPKFVFHQHGAEDLKAIAAGTMQATLMEQMFREYVRGLTNREDGLDKEEESDDGRGSVATGWPASLTELAISVKRNQVAPGKIDVPMSSALSVAPVLVKMPAGTNPAPIIVRRRIPNSEEELMVLKPAASAGQAVTSADRPRDEVMVERGVVALPATMDSGEMLVPILLSSVKKAEGTANPLYAYRLSSPASFEATAASDGFHLKWTLPNLNGVPPGDALWGYFIYGRLAGGEVKLIQELRFPPEQSPGGLSGKGGSRSAVSIPVTTTEFVLPTVAGSPFEALGIACAELVAAEGSVPVVSPIQWAGAPADDLLKQLQQTRFAIVQLGGVLEVKADDNPNQQTGYSSQLKIATWGYPSTLQGVLDVAKSYGKTIEVPKVTWSGADFSIEVKFGPLSKTSTARTGTTVSTAQRSLIIRGRYDAKTRSVVDVQADFESRDTGDFTPDPNWRPRSTVESLLGAPKPSKSLNYMQITVRGSTVPYVKREVDQIGNIWFEFSLRPTKAVAGYEADYRMEYSETEKPGQKKHHHLTIGPPSRGVQTYPMGIWVVFVVPKQ